MAQTINGASPSVNFEIKDFTFLNGNPQPNATSLGVVGETLKGKAFTPMFIDTYSTFQQCFGGLDPCTNTQGQLKYEAPYIAKQYLQESGSLFVTRVLGLSGYDAGDAWGITVGGAIDPATIQTTTDDTFEVDVEFVNGSLNNVTFNRAFLQELYDEGKFDSSIFGSSTATSGDTITAPNTFLGDCDGNFTGANFEGVATNVDVKFICISGTTTTSTTTNTTEIQQNCIVNYQAGTITQNSIFVIEVVNSIVFINTANNGLITVNNGLVQINGGTITHNSDGSIIISNGNIFLPDGRVLMLGTYKLCSLEDNDAVYDCDTISGVGYTISSGTTNITVPVITTTTNTIEREIPTGIVTVTYSGTFNNLTGSANSLDGTLVLNLRSKANYDGNEVLTFQVRDNSVSITPINGTKINPLDDFRLSGTYTNGSQFNYTVSFDRRKPSYIGRVFGSGSIQCCDTKVPFYIEENYIVYFESLVNSGQIDCIKTSTCFNSSFNNYKTQYRNAITPWVVSEVKGNKVFRLFRFHTMSDGDAANSDIKISIENIRPDQRDFDVVVRQFNDTDRNPVVLERYSRVNLSKTSNTYIGLSIGTTNGFYPLNSKYIMVEIADDCLDESYPAGFEGYPTRDWGDCKLPEMTYKTNYLTSERQRNVYLGISDTVGIEQDFFDYKGISPNTVSLEWSGRTSGFHMDKDSVNVTVEGDANVTFKAGLYSFKNELELDGTDYEKLVARKFTLVPYGGFDGWDIHRESRTNTDEYTKQSGKAILGVSVGNFQNLAISDEVDGITSDYYAYLKGILTFDNPEDVAIDLMATAGIDAVNNSDLIEATIEMIENDRCDAFYIFNMLDYNSAGDPLSVDNMVDLISDLYDTPYAASYVHWGLYNDTENNTRVYLPPTAEVVRILAKTDRLNAPWYAGAGITRAKTVFTNLRAKLRESQRDVLYEGRLNPLIADSGSYYIFGNRTMLDNDTSALRQISLVRLVLYLRKVINPIAKRLLFEPNDAGVRNQFRREVEPILRDVRDNRGLTAYRINLSESAADIDNGVLNGSIILIATPSLEEINISFVLKPTGSTFEVN